MNYVTMSPEQVEFATMSGREKYLFDLQGFLVAPLMEPFAGKGKSRGGRYFSDTLPDTSTIPAVLTKPTCQIGFLS